jgi:kynureninase
LSENIQGQLSKWASQAVEGHFTEPTPWVTIDDIVVVSMARLVGARPAEVVVMNSLTANLHFMMSSFYKPTAERFKIITEKKAFPSDTHAVVSQLLMHGLDPKTALVEVGPRDGEDTLREEDILQVIREHGSETALIMFCGLHYYTGQFFDMAKIAEVGHEQGCLVGFDLAHAVGNVPLQLHDWDADFACWCSYKYLNCGPGSIGGCFVHERHTTVEKDEAGNLVFRNRLSGWWGHRLEDRFLMAPDFIPNPGAYGFRLSNPSTLLIACVRTSLDLFDAAGMNRLRAKSVLLTGYLEYLLRTELPGRVKIITPTEPSRRGSQLSVSFDIDIDEASQRVTAAGVICDVRRPNVMRIAPAPLYNSFGDIYEFVQLLKKSM